MHLTSGPFSTQTLTSSLNYRSDNTSGMLELFYFHEIRNDCSHSKAINKIFFFFLHLWNICLFFLSKVWANIETFMSTCNPPEGRRKIYIWCESTNSGSRHGIQHGHIIVKYVIIHEVFNPTKALTIGLKTHLHCCATSSGDKTEKPSSPSGYLRASLCLLKALCLFFFTTLGSGASVWM